MNENPVTIRRAVPDDADVYLAMMRELAAHQDQLRHVAVTAGRCRELLAREDVVVLLAGRGDRVLGYVSVVRHLNIWAGCDIFGLDDLYVRPEARNAGIGRMLMTEAARLAAEDRMVVRWEVHHDNEAAQRFYTRLGATLNPKITASWPPSAYEPHLTGTVWRDAG